MYMYIIYTYLNISTHMHGWCNHLPICSFSFLIQTDACSNIKNLLLMIYSCSSKHKCALLSNKIVADFEFPSYPISNAFPFVVLREW